MFMENGKQFLKSAKGILGNKTEVDKDLAEGIAKRVSALRVMASVQFKASQFNSYYEDALRNKKKVSKKKKAVAVQDSNIQAELTAEVLKKGKINTWKLEAEAKAKLEEQR